MNTEKNPGALSDKQENAFRLLCKKLRVDYAKVEESVEVPEEEDVAYLAAGPGTESLIKPKASKLENLEVLLDLVGADPDQRAALEDHTVIPPIWKQEISSAKFSDSDDRDFKHALNLVLLGHADKVESYLDDIGKHFFPMLTIAYAAKNFTVKTGKTLVIKGNNHNLVNVNYGTLTLEQGGHIRCETNVVMNVQNFVKAPASN